MFGGLPPEVRRNQRQRLNPHMRIVVFARRQLMELTGIGFPAHTTEFQKHFAGFAIDAIPRAGWTSAFTFFEWQPKVNLFRGTRTV